MNRTLARITVVLAVVTSLLGTALVGQAAIDNSGKDWRQLTETTGLTWNQVATVCPRDGVTPCTGSVGGRNLTGWVWATREQVLNLFGTYSPDILTSPTGSVGGGFAYFVAAESFFGFLQPTFQVFLTYSTARLAGGWTATTDSDAQPYVGSVGDGTTPVSVSGSFSVVTTANADAVDSMRGVFLWRPIGVKAIDSVSDYVRTSNKTPGILFANVLANDTLAGVPATTANVQLSQISLTPATPYIKLNVTTGEVELTKKVAAATYSLVYQICEINAPSNCDQATMTLELTGRSR